MSMSYEITRYRVTASRTVVPTEALISSTDIVKSDTDLNDPTNGLPSSWLPGFQIHDEGFNHIKEKSLSGHWEEV